MKKMFKVGAAAVIAATCALSACSKKDEKAAASKPAEQGKVLNIYCWNEEFQNRMRDFYPGYVQNKDGTGSIGDVKVVWTITPSTDNAYQNKLDEVLYGQKTAKQDEKIDLFLVEADYALKYTEPSYTLDVIKDVGLTEADLSAQYQYTKDIMTNSKGALKGVSWQACPGGFIYNRSRIKAVIGTDEPDEVQKYLSDWAKFDEVAAQAKTKGYKMLSGYDDAFRVFSDNMKSPWVVDGKINIDDQIRAWIKQTKDYSDNGFNNRAGLWSAESWAGAKSTGDVIGYFGPAWFLDFSLAPQVKDDSDGPNELGNGTYGDWAFCKGPQGFSWGGTWICAAEGSDNLELVKDIMLKLTCDSEIMTQIAKVANDFANNEKAMEVVANSDYANPFLGGQNHIKFFLDSAKSISKTNISKYDQGMSEKIQAAMKDYFDGKVDEATAWENFYKSIEEKYPALQR